MTHKITYEFSCENIYMDVNNLAIIIVNTVNFRFEILVAVYSRNETPCILTDCYQHFEDTCCPQFCSI